ncbi:MAG: hypothetical protein ABJH63_12525 [Rhizobiaceae bacterium]
MGAIRDDLLPGEVLKDGEVLQDGEGVSVPLFFMDSASPAGRGPQASLYDAAVEIVAGDAAQADAERKRGCQRQGIQDAQTLKGGGVIRSRFIDKTKQAVMLGGRRMVTSDHGLSPLTSLALGNLSRAEAMKFFTKDELEFITRATDPVMAGVGYHNAMMRLRAELDQLNV